MKNDIGEMILEWYASLCDMLLPKLISGELRVPDTERLIEEAGG